MNRFSFIEKKERYPLATSGRITLKRFKECVSSARRKQAFSLLPLQIFELTHTFADALVSAGAK
ncbi:hypothetical protein C3460_13535 [Serratia marcescens]|nr:hypothetical protein CS368_01325 [Serratia marcescens]POW86881.1 hypothetical protein C3461_12335 [Serratia marcescens]POW91177.1 hypothetical protein C3459_12390 [Serratia marcescens]POW95479.1 hypothetical protein C3462_14575 [Serratia marcescens]POX00393.1 hypothetical protein C3466_13550 [Serratia marcescens]